MNANVKRAIGVGVATLAVIVFLASAYIVDAREQVVVTQFGRVIGKAVTEPGLHFRVPFVQNANYLPKNILEWDGESGELPTEEKTLIWVDTFARWRISDPLLFYRATRTERNALLRLTDLIDAAVRDAVAAAPLIDTVRESNRTMEILDQDMREVNAARAKAVVKLGRPYLTEMVRKAAGERLAPFGIVLVDVKIKRLNYRKEVRDSVYNRMVAERKQIAEKYRSEGKGEARKIQGDMEREMKRITSEAYRKAQEIKGRADGLATAIYASAYNRDPAFYSFLRSLDVYRESLGKDDSLLLSTDTELFKYLEGRGVGK
ncbi:MAG: protease modulator HflC [Deltaproteobacteria bacterium]|nr:protease modulator HflC [Deltaproteobacteria bacterium]